MYNERPEYAGIGYCWIIVCPDDAAKARVLKDFSKVTFESHLWKEIWRCVIGPTHLRKFLLASCESHLSEIERVLVVKVFFRKRWAVSAVNGRSETHDVIDPRFVVVMTIHDYIMIVSQLYVCLVMLFGCRPPGYLDCEVGALSEQCGEEIAGHYRTLIERIHLQIGCESRKRLYSCF